MNIYKIVTIVFVVVLFNGCASIYKNIEPSRLNYQSNDVKNSIIFEYKYDLLRKKYRKKEERRGIKIVALKITNNTEKDIVFGKDFKLVYTNGKDVHIMDKDKVYSNVKQSTLGYLFYLLLTPLKFYVETPNSYSETPVGLVIGPGLAGGNMLVAGSANTKFKKELEAYSIVGETIKKGETKSGLIGIRSYSFDSIELEVLDDK